MAHINVRVDKEIKDDAEKAFKDMGLDMSTAITIFLMKVVREQKIPFEINTGKSDPFYSKENMERLKKSAAEMERTGGTVHDIGENSSNV